MDYNTLLDLCTQLGYHLAMCGAETFRVEDSINRIMAAYGIESEVFATTNNLIVSIESVNNEPMTRMHRIGFHGNNLAGVESFNALSRRICSEKPNPSVAMQWLVETEKSVKYYPLPITILGNVIGAAGYAMFFGGNWLDLICAAGCGLIVGLTTHWMNKLKVNPFFSILLNAFLASLVAYAMGAIGIAPNADSVIIGTFMILVPGLIFTNAMRDIIYGDTNSGINRIIQVILIAAACALGTGIAWAISISLWGEIISMPDLQHPLWLQCLTATFGCIGFTILFNVHGRGSFLCVLGGGLTWAIYGIGFMITENDILCCFLATLFAAFYAEFMARFRKCPAIAYLVVSLFPLIPGASIYYTGMKAMSGEMSEFINQAAHTVAIAGALAVGILIVSTLFRLFGTIKQRKK